MELQLKILLNLIIVSYLGNIFMVGMVSTYCWFPSNRASLPGEIERATWTSPLHNHPRELLQRHLLRLFSVSRQYKSGTEEMIVVWRGVGWYLCTAGWEKQDGGQWKTEIALCHTILIIKFKHWRSPEGCHWAPGGKVGWEREGTKGLLRNTIRGWQAARYS